MGRKSHYFRHTFTAHLDPKIVELVDIEGAKALGVYWTLIEMYGAALRDDDEQKEEQAINLRTLANAVNLRRNHLNRCLVAIEKCSLGVCRLDAKRTSICYVTMFNFMKYYGSYTKSGEPFRTNKRKEKQRKEKKSIILEKQAPAKAQRSESDKEKARQIKKSFCNAYLNRYGIAPTWSVKENRLVYTLITQVGYDEALDLSSRYVSEYHDPWHVKHKHPFSYLVSQVDKVRVELANPSRMVDHINLTKQLNTHATEDEYAKKREAYYREQKKLEGGLLNE